MDMSTGITRISMAITDDPTHPIHAPKDDLFRRRSLDDLIQPHLGLTRMSLRSFFRIPELDVKIYVYYTIFQ